MDYKIVGTSCKDTLSGAINSVELKVKNLIKEGYEPLGGISIAVEMAGYSYLYSAAQAMIKD